MAWDGFQKTVAKLCVYYDFGLALSEVDLENEVSLEFNNQGRQGSLCDQRRQSRPSNAYPEPTLCHRNSTHLGS